MSEMEILDRIPPSDIQSEKGVLGSIFLDERRMGEVEGILQASDFYDSRHVGLWHTFVAMRREGMAIDATTLLGRLKCKGRLEEVGGTAYLAELAHAVPVAAHIADYAKLVLEKSQLRTLRDIALKALRDAYSGLMDPRTIESDITSALASTRSRGLDRKCMTSEECAEVVLKEVDRIVSGNGRCGQFTGLLQFDTQVGGLFPGELSILAARPGVGKTSLAIQWAYHSGLRGLVYFVTLEMGANELAKRCMCSLAGVSGQHLRTGKLRDGESGLLVESANVFAKTQWRVDANPQTTVLDIRRTATSLLSSGLRMVVIDYIQLLTPIDTKPVRAEQLAQMSRALKLLAIELQVPVLCVAQLNRKSEEDSRPRLHHLRESGALEQDADVVMFLHRKEEVDQRDRAVETSLIVEKNRNGPVGTIKVLWDAKLTRYCDAEVAPGYSEFDAFDGGE